MASYDVAFQSDFRDGISISPTGTPAEAASQTIEKESTVTAVHALCARTLRETTSRIGELVGAWAKPTGNGKKREQLYEGLTVERL
ncbi:MAG: hypothetical protein ABGY41_11140, partial [Candidatus Poribacteria bacterium]